VLIGGVGYVRDGFVEVVGRFAGDNARVFGPTFGLDTYFYTLLVTTDDVEDSTVVIDGSAYSDFCLIRRTALFCAESGRR
jgi:hypothetical protein